MALPCNAGRRCLAGVAAAFRHVAVSAEIPVWKGRRYGNLVAVASAAPLPLVALELVDPRFYHLDTALADLVGALRRAMATTGYTEVKEFQRVEIVVH